MAQLTLRQFDQEAKSLSDGADSVVYEEEAPFTNIFTQDKAHQHPEGSRHNKHTSKSHKKDTVPHHTLPKMQFPTFDGTNPKVWLDNCRNYFSIYSVPESVWVTAATMHLQDNAAKWYQAYKQTHTNVSLVAFSVAVEQKFGIDDYRNAIAKLLALKQNGTVEEYTSRFQALQFDITMHSCHYDDLFFATM